MQKNQKNTLFKFFTSAGLAGVLMSGISVPSYAANATTDTRIGHIVLDRTCRYSQALSTDNELLDAFVQDTDTTNQNTKSMVEMSGILSLQPKQEITETTEIESTEEIVEISSSKSIGFFNSETFSNRETSIEEEPVPEDGIVAQPDSTEEQNIEESLEQNEAKTESVIEITENIEENNLETESAKIELPDNSTEIIPEEIAREEETEKLNMIECLKEKGLLNDQGILTSAGISTIQQVLHDGQYLYNEPDGSYGNVTRRALISYVTYEPIALANLDAETKELILYVYKYEVGRNQVVEAYKQEMEATAEEIPQSEPLSEEISLEEQRENTVPEVAEENMLPEAAIIETTLPEETEISLSKDFLEDEQVEENEAIEENINETVIDTPITEETVPVEASTEEEMSIITENSPAEPAGDIPEEQIIQEEIVEETNEEAVYYAAEEPALEQLTEENTETVETEISTEAETAETEPMTDENGDITTDGIIAVQEALIDNGYLDDIPDGSLGPLTQEAIVEYINDYDPENTDAGIVDVNIQDLICSEYDKMVEAQEQRSATSAFRHQVVGFALSFVGVTPYVPAGGSLYSGTDCSGFVNLIFQNFGIGLSPASLAYDGYNFGRRVSYEELQPGDIVVYDGGAHVGIYAGNDCVIHCSSPENGTCYWNMWYRNISWFLNVID